MDASAAILSERLSYECDTRRFPHGRREEKAFWQRDLWKQGCAHTDPGWPDRGNDPLAVVLTVIFSINGGYRVTLTPGAAEKSLSEAALWKISGKA